MRKNIAVTELDMIYAVKLKSLRKASKINQDKMFEHLGLDRQQQYSDLEMGKKHFTDEIVVKICNLFNISILQFISNKKESNLSLFLNSEDYDIIENSTDHEIKITLYRKLLIEAKIENTELKLELLHKDYNFKNPPKNSTHIMI